MLLFNKDEYKNRVKDFNENNAEALLKEIENWVPSRGLRVYLVPDWALRGIDFRVNEKASLGLICLETLDNKTIQR
jgi:hypothetical protein